jgi:hypothetical protein
MPFNSRHRIGVAGDSVNSATDANGNPLYDFNVHNVATHEFGHFILLKDLGATGCEAQTMWKYFVDYDGPKWETSKRSLEAHDIEGAVWQAP